MVEARPAGKPARSAVRVTTDGKGAFFIPVPLGDYVLTAFTDKLVSPAELPIHVAADVAADACVVRLVPKKQHAALACSTERSVLAQVAQDQITGACRGQLGWRQSTMAFHHAQQIVEPLPPSLVHLTFPKSPRENMWVGRQRGEVRGFERRERGDFLAEIYTRRLSHAANSWAQLDDIKIEFKHPIFAEELVQAPSQDGLFQLPGDRPLVGEEEILGELLRDGAGAASECPVFQILSQGVANHVEVEAFVVEEFGILGREEGRRQVPRHERKGNEVREGAAERQLRRRGRRDRWRGR